MKETLDVWLTAAGIESGPLFRCVCREGKLWGHGISDKTVWHVVKRTVASADFPEMVTLAILTEPGPFRDHTANLGGFVGIRVDGRLAAMAGQRLAPTGFAEVSAVCTHPGFHGRGYAQALVAAVTRNIHSEGRMPFLTSFEANTGAIRIYKQVGFVHRRTFQRTVLKPPSPPQ